MSTSYPKVHVVGSGAYYSYRPITRFIEKVDRNHIRDCSSRPKDFSKYLAASSSRGDGYTRGQSLEAARDFFRGSSLPPFDSSEKKASSSSRKVSDSVFKKGFDDPFFKEYEDSSLLKRGKNESSYSRRSEKSFRQEDDSVFESDRKALFSTDDDILTRLRRKHPYRLPVENEVVPPHESSIWPENRKHFDLVSSYDTMIDYLGIREKSKK